MQSVDCQEQPQKFFMEPGVKELDDHCCCRIREYIKVLIIVIESIQELISMICGLVLLCVENPIYSEGFDLNSEGFGSG